MTEIPFHCAQLLRLCGELRDQTISPPDMAKLEQLIVADERARSFFLSFMQLTALLEQRTSQQTRVMSDDSEDESTRLILDSLGLMEQNSDSEIVDVTEQLQRRQANHLTRRQALESRFDHLVGRVEPVKPVRHIVIPKTVFYGAVAAVLAMAMTLIWSLLPPTPQSSAPLASSTSTGPVKPALIAVASIIEQVDAKWLTPGSTPGNEPAPGSKLLNQPIHLVAGLAKLRFHNEAEVILEAPCSIEPISEDEIKITHGKLVGRCETAASRGFVVQTPSARIVDLGTEFGVSVDRQGAVEAHVFEGEIELAMSPDAEPMRVRRGQARQVDQTGSRVSELIVDELAFIRDQTFEAKAHANQSAGHRWRTLLGRLHRDPYLILHYDMNAVNDGQTMPNLAIATAGVESLHGRAQGVVAAPGRFEGDNALEFTDQRQDLSLDIPGEFNHLTLAAWVQLYPNSGSFDYRGLLMTDSWLAQGQVHWQGNLTDHLQLSWLRRSDLSEVITEDHPASQAALSPSPLKDSPPSWRLLVSVYDATRASVSHYIDGQPVGQNNAYINFKLRFGPTHVGAWRTQVSGRPIVTRPLNGRIDDLLIWDRALSREEVQTLYQNSKP